MVKLATTSKAVRTGAATFWVCLVSWGAAIEFARSPAIANEIQRSPQDAAVVSASEEALSLPEAERDETDTVQTTVAQDRAAPVGVLEEPLTVDEVTRGGDVIADSGEMEQITNVSQLSDVRPTDWAYEALRSLVERYNCIAGYPDSTFRGKRSLTRYEFAAGVNACLRQIERLISTTGDGVTQKDLEILRRLAAEFQAEIASLGTRVDKQEGRVAVLEGQQFSTTTKLNGLAWSNITGAFANSNVRVETADLNNRLELRGGGRDATGKPIVQNIKDDPSITFSNLVWLTLETSFTGKDRLVTQLAAGNGESPANVFASAGLFNTFGVPFTDQSAGIQGENNNVILRELFYSFPLGNNIQVVFGPRVNWYRYFDNNAFNFFLTGASSFNSSGNTLLNTIDRGAGAVVLWDINKQFRLRVGYLGESDEFLPGGLFNSATNPRQGVFSGTNTITAEFTFSPSDKTNLRFIYNRSTIQPIFGTIGGATGEPIYGVADDGFGGPLRVAKANTFGFNFDWLISSSFGVFGRYTYGTTHLDPKTPGRASGDVNAQSIQFGFGFPDLGKKGALGTLSFLIPFNVLNGRNFLVAGGGNGGTQYEIEATYFYPLTNNIAIVPAFYFIGNPNNFNNNPSIYVGNLRTQFSF